MTCGIYMIQNLVNGKVYIGQAVDIEKRWKQHGNELRGNRHYNTHLQHAWNKDGEDNFEFTIICECDENQLNTMEEYYIFELMSYDDRVGYNKNYGGSSGRPTEEAKRNLSEARKGKYCGENHPWYGKHHSEETKKKHSEFMQGRYTGKSNAFYGKHHSEETKKKISEAKIGKYGGENHPNYGKHLPEETRKKISETLTGKYTGEKNPMYGKHHSEEARKKIGEANKGENNPWYGKHLPEETRRKIGEANKGKHHTEETKRKLSEAKKGTTMSEETKKKISETLTGRIVSEETRKKLRENHPRYWKGKHFSEETRKKMSESTGKGIKHIGSIPVVQLTLDGQLVNVYGSAGEAERDGFVHQAIGKCCKGKYKTHKHYKWMYLHEYIAKMNPNIKTVNLFGKTYEVNKEEVKMG